MAIKYKQLCRRCKQNYVIVTSKQDYITCYDCQKKDLGGKIKDPKMKKLFDIPESYYQENLFLRSIKLNYLRCGSLTDKQIGAFKKTVKRIKESETKSIALQ